MKQRYQLVLLPCEATNPDFWNVVVESANKIADLHYDDTLTLDQLFKIIDIKTGREYTMQEFYAICDKR